jgi:predicted nucleotidyltransferase
MDAGERLAAIARRFHLDAVYVFGSRAGEVSASVARGAPLTVSRSDVDIGVLPEPGQHLDARRRVDLVVEFEGLFDGARVDLVVLPEAPAMLAADIVSGELLVAGDHAREAEYQLYALRRAADLAPFERERRAIVLEGGR